MNTATEKEIPWVEAAQLYQDRQNSWGIWREISEDQYVQFIEGVPPVAGGYGYCLCGEPYTHDTETGMAIYPAVKEQGGKYWITLMTAAEFRSGQYRYHR